MSIIRRPTGGATLLGGSIAASPSPCEHAPARRVTPWIGEPGTSGTVAVVGAGKMGLPLAAQFASHGWDVIAVDVQQSVVDSINAGRSHIGAEPGLADLVRQAHVAGRLRATTDGTAAAREADVVVIIVPVMLDADARPDFAFMDGAAGAIGPGLHPGSTVIFETTLPVGTTRGRYVPRLESASGLHVDEDLFVAFSPERLYSGAALANLATYPKLVGGIGPRSGERAAAFYASVLDADIHLLSSAEAAEFSKLADTTYRDVNIALANEFAAYADRVGVDVREVIAAANTQPYSHIHQPGLGVGGHCIPVYPHFLLSADPSLTLVARAREINDGQLDLALDAIASIAGGIRGTRVLVLGLTYRSGVKELAYSRGVELVARLASAGAAPVAHDPLLSADEIRRLGAEPYSWGTPDDALAIVSQTDDPLWSTLDPANFPNLRVLVDGRNSLVDLALPDAIAYRGIGVSRVAGS
jgi:nucleotide sugar dehydrogenase